MAAIRAQLSTIPVPDQSFSGQTIIVTGSNTGLGLEAAKHFVRLGAARVILAVRTIKKGEVAKASIEASTNRKDVVEVWELDMSKYSSITAFGEKAKSLDRLDVVVANAGVMKNTYEEAEGTESTIAVNVIGTFLLALNLFPILRKSKGTGKTPILVITSSLVHENAKFAERNEPSIFTALAKNNKAYIEDRYNVSKLLEVFLVRSIGASMQTGLHAGEPLILNAVNPGLCHSQLDRTMAGVAGYVFKIAKTLLGRTTEVGGRTLVHSAAAGTESHGQYMSECKVKEPSAFVRSDEGAKTQQLCRRFQPREAQSSPGWYMSLVDDDATGNDPVPNAPGTTRFVSGCQELGWAKAGQWTSGLHHAPPPCPALGMSWSSRTPPRRPPAYRTLCLDSSRRRPHLGALNPQLRRLFHFHTPNAYSSPVFPLASSTSIDPVARRLSFSEPPRRADHATATSIAWLPSRPHLDDFIIAPAGARPAVPVHERGVAEDAASAFSGPVPYLSTCRHISRPFAPDFTSALSRSIHLRRRSHVSTIA
ncbi:hypothetical protein G7046_g6701 [Stylonectria norvegica]|nr:hypothetical protein G7046_g6701 [Stylonectria norvegica]